MKVKTECVLSDSKLTKIYKTFPKPRSHSLNDFISRIKNNRLMDLKRDELLKILRYLVNQMGIMIIGKRTPKMELSRTLRRYLYGNPKRKCEFDEEDYPLSDDFEYHDGEDEIHDFLKYQQILLDDHHPVINPIYSIKGIMDIPKEKTKTDEPEDQCTLTFNQHEIRMIKKGKLKLQLYPLTRQKGRKMKYIPVNWDLDLNVFVEDKELKHPEKNESLAKLEKNDKLVGSMRKIDGQEERMNYVNNPITISPELFDIQGDNELEIAVAQNVDLDFPTIIYAVLTKKQMSETEIVKYMEFQSIQNQEFRTNGNEIMMEHNSKRGYEEDIQEMKVDQTLDLLDPLLFNKIEVPIRGLKCIHPRCFDLLTYLEYSKEQKELICPICRSLVPYREIYIDERVRYILSTVDEDVEKVYVHHSKRYFQEKDPETGERREKKYYFPNRGRRMKVEGKELDFSIPKEAVLKKEEQEIMKTQLQVSEDEDSSSSEEEEEEEGEEGVELAVFDKKNEAHVDLEEELFDERRMIDEEVERRRRSSRVEKPMVYGSGTWDSPFRDKLLKYDDDAFD